MGFLLALLIVRSSQGWSIGSIAQNPAGADFSKIFFHVFIIDDKEKGACFPYAAKLASIWRASALDKFFILFLWFVRRLIVVYV